MSNGKPMTTDLILTYPDRQERMGASSSKLVDFAKLQKLRLELHPNTDQLKIWVHELNLRAISTGIPAQVQIYHGDRLETVDLSAQQAQVIMPFPSGMSRLEIHFRSASTE
jgi:hypothetical protein